MRGDIFLRMIVSGREEVTPDALEEALRQLNLRYTLAASTADTYFGAGFTVVVQDNILGAWLQEFVAMIQSQSLAVALSFR
ncbi:MAG: hypothetical protein GX354_09445 [Firmicutes bacterium]|nr:hypothetical protein [Bacillota bacterium]